MESPSYSVIWHVVLPDDINHNLSDYQQHLPLLSLEKKAYHRLQINHKHLIMQEKLKAFTYSDIIIK